MYAIVQSGGKQYKVRPGDTIEVERLEAEPGDWVELEPVLFIGGGEDGTVSVGQPALASAKVVAEVVDHPRAKKIVVFKFKPKVRYRRKTGHRQSLTRLRIKEIRGE